VQLRRAGARRRRAAPPREDLIVHPVGVLGHPLSSGGRRVAPVVVAHSACLASSRRWATPTVALGVSVVGYPPMEDVVFLSNDRRQRRPARRKTVYFLVVSWCVVLIFSILCTHDPRVQ
jgi:hypothetical protein